MQVKRFHIIPKSYQNFYLLFARYPLKSVAYYCFLIIEMPASLNIDLTFSRLINAWLNFSVP